jgi:Fur family transcriptional regulator, stress-responsive regulator
MDLGTSSISEAVGRNLLDRLQARRWRLTPQRRAVAQAMAGDHVHLTAEQIHVAARRFVPEVSLATVYNTLNDLVALGEVSEVRIADGSVRYDPNARDEHHHLVCDSCGLIFDVEPTGLSQLGLAPADRYGITIDRVEVTFRGQCSSCGEQRGASNL